MTKKIKILSISIVVIALVAVLGLNFVLNKGARDVSSEDTAYNLNSKKIIEDYASNSEACNKIYLDKAIAISGTVTSIKGKELILDHSIICNLNELDTTLKENQTIIVKGRLVGFDDLLGEIKLDQCFKTQ